MVVTNLYSNKKFEPISFSRLKDDYSKFTLQVRYGERKDYIKDLKRKGKYYKLTHNFDDPEDNFAPKMTSVQFFKVLGHRTIKTPTEGFFMNIGTEIFMCQELDNFGQAKMVYDLTRLDPKRKWYKILKWDAQES